MKPTATRSQRASILAASLLTVPILSAAPIVMSGPGSYTQDFNTLPTVDAVFADDTTIPGWYGTSSLAAQALKANNGSTNNGAFYSFGTGTDAERAFGSIASGTSGTLRYGVIFQNTGTTAVQINSVTYTGEEWRYSGTSAAQPLTFDYEVTPSGTVPTLIDSTFISVPALTFTSPVITGTAGPLDGNAAANRAVLTNNPAIIVPAGSYVLLRWTDINDAGNDHGLAIDDLSVTWAASTGDTTPPAVTTFSPADDATNVSRDFTTALSITFSENIKAGTGNVVLKKASDNSTVQTFGIADASTTVIEGNKVTFTKPDLSAFLASGTAYYVQIPATAIKDIAGNSYAGITNTTSWNFSTPTPPAPTVVINKYNSTTDEVDLLVTGDGVTGHTVNLQGMVLKDFSANTTSDGGGSFTFTTDAKWAAVPVGTIIHLTNTANTVDIDYADFIMEVGMQDATYFTATGPGTFDIASSELVMIKAAGSPVAGYAGGIHALAGVASPGSYYIDFPGAKALAPGGSPNVAVNNSHSTLADYSSDYTNTDAAAGNTSEFGAPNTPGNAAYISALRGVAPGNGDGIASVTNLTSGSAYNGSGIFAPSQTGQTAKITLNAYQNVTLAKVNVTVPTALGVPGTVTLSGAGATGATFTKSGQTITITGASATQTNALEITIAGLSTPVAPTGLTDTGNIPFTVTTSAATGTPAALLSPPAVVLPVQIASLRDVDANGVPLDVGATVAVTGVVTQGNFTTVENRTSGFMQDATGGINVFSSTSNLNLVRGTRYTILGKIVHFNGVTELVPASASAVISLGADTQPTAELVTLATLFANPEAYEGKLIKVAGLTRKETEADAWASGATISTVDSGGTTLDIFIQTASTATTEPTYPADITGIFSQFDSSSPYTAGYELLPRDPNDLSTGTTPTNNYSSWATTHGVSGEAATADHDKDGISNLLEYALGLDPVVANTTPGTLNPATRTVTFTKGSEAVANNDLIYTIETSTTLAAGSWTSVTANPDTTTTIGYTLPAGQSKVFVRLSVSQKP